MSFTRSLFPLLAAGTLVIGAANAQEPARAKGPPQVAPPGLTGYDCDPKPFRDHLVVARELDLDRNGLIDEKERRAALHVLCSRRTKRRDPGTETSSSSPDSNRGRPSAGVAYERIARARALVNEELTRRRKAAEFSEEQRRERQARTVKDHKKSSMAAYSRLASKGKAQGRGARGSGAGRGGGARPSQGRAGAAKRGNGRGQGRGRR